MFLYIIKEKSVNIFRYGIFIITNNHIFIKQSLYFDLFFALENKQHVYHSFIYIRKGWGVL